MPKTLRALLTLGLFAATLALPIAIDTQGGLGWATAQARHGADDLAPDDRGAPEPQPGDDRGGN